MTEKSPKRPRDLNQWAKHMVDLATGEVDQNDKKEHPKKDAPKQAVSKPARGRKVGSEGTS